MFRPVNNFKCKKTAGPDGVSPRLLKDIAYSISKPLTTIFNMSHSIKQVPLLWKIAHVSQFFKGKGNPHSPLTIALYQ